MAELTLVVPMYKVDSYFAARLADEVVDGPDPAVVLHQLPASRPGTHSLQSVLDSLAATDASAVGQRLASEAMTEIVRVGGVEVDLDGRPDAVHALFATAEAVVDAGVDCVVLCRWLSHPEDLSNVLPLAIRSAVRVVGVGDLRGTDVASEFSLLRRVALALDAASDGQCLFVLAAGEGPQDLPEPFSHGERAIVIESLDDLRQGPGQARLAGWLGRSPRPEPVRPGSISEAMAAYGLPDCYVPSSLHDEVKPLRGTPSLYAFGTTEVDAEAAYMLLPSIEAVLAADWSPRLQVSAFGHGINSYAHSYTLVADGLAVIAQVGFGLLTEPSEVGQAWGSLMADIEELHRQVLAAPPREGTLLAVISSDLRGRSSAGVLDREASLEDRRAALQDAVDPIWQAANLVAHMSSAPVDRDLPGPTSSARRRTVEMWDDVLSEWMKGREVWREPAYEGLGRWFGSYSGDVDLRHYPDPYVGDLAGTATPPRIVVLGLNPGVGYDELQARDGIWARGIAAQGYSRFHDRIPFENAAWTDIHGRNSPYWRNLVYFARRWTEDSALLPTEVLNMELYPWHSDRVEGAIRPPADVLREHVWEPLADVGLPTVFAFGRPWLEVCQGLGLRRVAWLGDHAEADSPLPSPNWNVAVFELPSGQHVVISWQSGFAGPPGLRRIGELKQALLERGVPLG